MLTNITKIVSDRLEVAVYTAIRKRFLDIHITTKSIKVTPETLEKRNTSSINLEELEIEKTKGRKRGCYRCSYQGVEIEFTELQESEIQVLRGVSQRGMIEGGNSILGVRITDELLNILGTLNGSESIKMLMERFYERKLKDLFVINFKKPGILGDSITIQ